MNAMDLLKALNDIDERFLIEHEKLQENKKNVNNKKNRRKLLKNKEKNLD